MKIEAICKLCGEDLTEPSLPEAGRTLLDHFRLVHPAQWEEEFRPALDAVAAWLRGTEQA